MAKSTPAEKRYAKRYYESHPKKKAEKIAKQVKKQQANKSKFARMQRERYHLLPYGTFQLSLGPFFLLAQHD